MYAKQESLALGMLGLVLFGGLWEFAADRGWINPVTLSSPGRIGDALVRQWASGDLLRDLQVSLVEFLIGFAISAVIGIAVGIVMALNSNAEFALDPFIWFFYSAPIVALYPLIIVWLGFGFWTVIAITVALTAITITINTLAGLRSVDPLLIRAARSFGGGSMDVVWKVMLPGSLPMVLAGLRIGLGRALIGVVIGELFSANVGLGFRMTYYGARLRTSDVLVPLLLIILIGVLSTQVVRFFEDRLVIQR